MKSKIFGLMILVCLIALTGAQAAATGTAWGILIGSPSSDTDGYHLTLHVAGIAGGDETLVDCGAWGSWCSSITSNETVIVSFSTKPSLACSGSVFLTHLVMDGVSKSHYCYPGPCGT